MRNSTSDAEYSAHAILDSPEISKTQTCSRNGSPWLENQHEAVIFSAFFEARLMVTTVKTMIFVNFVFFLFSDFFRFVGGG